MFIFSAFVRQRVLRLFQTVTRVTVFEFLTDTYLVFFTRDVNAVIVACGAVACVYACASYTGASPHAVNNKEPNIYGPFWESYRNETPDLCRNTNFSEKKKKKISTIRVSVSWNSIYPLT